MSRRKLCRAAACPRKIPDDALFCNVHLRQLTPRYLDPIADNREAPAGAADSVARRVISGTQDAVRFLAKKEGRATDLATAEKVGVTEPGQSAGGSGISGLPAYKREQLEGGGRFTERVALD